MTLRANSSAAAWIRIGAIEVALVYAVVLVWQMLRNSWGIGGAGKYCRDFTWIWLSGRLAQSPAPVQIYDHSAFAAARAALVGPPDCLLGHFDNPPTILFLTRPLGALPYSAAFAVWLAATLCVYLAAVWAILPRPVAILAALVPYPVFINALLGHNGFLTAGLVGGALVFAERRPLLCGLFLALLTYKPQFGILFPLALIVSRNWRALFAAAALSVIFACAAGIVFGWQTWPAFVGALGERAALLGRDPQLNFALVSTAGFLRMLGVGAPAAWAAQAAVSAATGVTVAILWARPIPYALKAAALAAGSLLAAPHAFGYDACILTIAAAFLVKDALQRGLLAGERLALLLCWAGLFVPFGPIPAVVSSVLLALAGRRAGRGRALAAAWQTPGQKP